jgi:hypothetical protein
VAQAYSTVTILAPVRPAPALPRPSFYAHPLAPTPRERAAWWSGEARRVLAEARADRLAGRSRMARAALAAAAFARTRVAFELTWARVQELERRVLERAA